MLVCVKYNTGVSNLFKMDILVHRKVNQLLVVCHSACKQLVVCKQLVSPVVDWCVLCVNNWLALHIHMPGYVSLHTAMCAPT